MRLSLRLIGFLTLSLALPGMAIAKKPCGAHAGKAGCDPSGFVLCQDGAVDRSFHCETVIKHKKGKKELKFRPPPDKGQILKPGEPPPADTLEESYREM